MIRFICTCSLLLSSLSAFALRPLAWETSQHTPVLFYETHHVPMVTIHIGFKAGSAYDGEHFGLAALTTEMLNQGNAGLSATQIANQFADAGALFSATTTRDMIAVSCTTLTSLPAFDQAIKTFEQVLTQPDFLPHILEQEKNQQLASIVDEQASPQTVASLAFFKTLYTHHPYGHSIVGTKETLSRLTIEEVRTFYQDYFVPDNAVMVIVGALSPVQAKQLSETLLKKRPQGRRAPPIPVAAPLTKATQKFLSFPASQTTLYLGQLGITHHDPAYFPLIVGNYILGGGSMTSRLTDALREKRGLTYHVDSEFVPMPGRGPFIIRLSTKTDQAHQAEQLATDLLNRFIQTGPTATEVAAAKQYLMGSFPLALSSNTDIANILLKMAFYQLPLDFLDTYTQRIQAVTTADIQAAFSKTLSNYPRLTVTVGQAGP